MTFFIVVANDGSLTFDGGRRLSQTLACDHLTAELVAMFADAGRVNFFDMFASFPHK